MTEKPILFSTEMVRAILDGRKTQTRRVVKPQPVLRDDDDPCWSWRYEEKNPPQLSRWFDVKSFGDALSSYCPYGQIGDLLWVRETWFPLHLGYATRQLRDEIWYRGNGNFDPHRDCAGQSWRSPIHMPRWASRITLEVTGVQVERLQDISTEDALAEGIQRHEQWTPRVQFSELWDSINAKRGYGWDSNPWVWVVEFKPVEDENQR